LSKWIEFEYRGGKVKL
jgi:hypothetical protein